MSSLCSNRRRRFGGRRGRTTLQCMRETRRKDVGRGGCPGWRVSWRAKKEGEELGEPGRYCAGTRHGRRRREFTVCKRASVRWRRNESCFWMKMALSILCGIIYSDSAQALEEVFKHSSEVEQRFLRALTCSQSEITRVASRSMGLADVEYSSFLVFFLENKTFCQRR